LPVNYFMSLVTGYPEEKNINHQWNNLKNQSS
jgi:hypothetical protein